MRFLSIDTREVSRSFLEDSDEFDDRFNFLKARILVYVERIEFLLNSRVHGNVFLVDLCNRENIVIRKLFWKLANQVFLELVYRLQTVIDKRKCGKQIEGGRIIGRKSVSFRYEFPRNLLLQRFVVTMVARSIAVIDLFLSNAALCT